MMATKLFPSDWDRQQHSFLKSWNFLLWPISSISLQQCKSLWRQKEILQFANEIQNDFLLNDIKVCKNRGKTHLHIVVITIFTDPSCCMTKMTSLHLSYFFDAHYEQLQINSEKNSQNSLPKRFMMNVLMNMFFQI